MRAHSPSRTPDLLPVTDGPKWLKWRQGGIGGSDIAAVVGLSKWASPFSVWASKVDLLPPSEPTPRQDIGHRLERVIGELFERETGLHVAAQQARVEHPDLPWCRATIDGLVHDHASDDEATLDNALGGFEAKTDGRFGWPDGPPANYLCQAQWSMAATGLDRWWFGVLFANFRFETFLVERDDADIAVLVHEASLFWPYVVNGNPPPLDDTDATAAAVKAAWPNHTPGMKVALERHRGATKLVARRARLKERVKTLGAELQEVESELRCLLHDAEVGTIRGEPVISYRRHERRVLRPTDLQRVDPALYARLEQVITYRTLRDASAKDREDAA